MSCQKAARARPKGRQQKKYCAKICLATYLVHKQISRNSKVGKALDRNVINLHFWHICWQDVRPPCPPLEWHSTGLWPSCLVLWTGCTCAFIYICFPPKFYVQRTHFSILFAGQGLDWNSQSRFHDNGKVYYQIQLQLREPRNNWGVCKQLDSLWSTYILKNIRVLTARVILGFLKSTYQSGHNGFSGIQMRRCHACFVIHSWIPLWISHASKVVEC